MANEITLSASLNYDDSEGTEDSLAISQLLVSVATKRITHLKMSVTTSEIAIPLGNIASLGWFMAVNRDETNYIEIRVGTGGTKIAKLKPGEFCLFRFGSGITAPYAIADTAACQCDFFLISL